MTELDQRAAFLKLAKWQLSPEHATKKEAWWLNTETGELRPSWDLPNEFDTNELHVLESELPDTYWFDLAKIVDRDAGQFVSFASGKANAKQRLEAILKHHGVWKDLP